MSGLGVSESARGEEMYLPCAFKGHKDAGRICKETILLNGEDSGVFTEFYVRELMELVHDRCAKGTRHDTGERAHVEFNGKVLSLEEGIPEARDNGCEVCTAFVEFVSGEVKNVKGVPLLKESATAKEVEESLRWKNKELNSRFLDIEHASCKEAAGSLEMQEQGQYMGKLVLVDVSTCDDWMVEGFVKIFQNNEGDIEEVQHKHLLAETQHEGMKRFDNKNLGGANMRIEVKEGGNGREVEVDLRDFSRGLGKIRYQNRILSLFLYYLKEFFMSKGFEKDNIKINTNYLHKT